MKATIRITDTIDGREVVEGVLEVLRLGEVAGKIVEIKKGEWHVVKLTRRLSKPMSLEAAARIVAARRAA